VAFSSAAANALPRGTGCAAGAGAACAGMMKANAAVNATQKNLSENAGNDLGVAMQQTSGQG
jgi:hypothetical protein